MLNKEDIDEYKSIYKKVYGEDISDTEAVEQANRLLRFFKIITTPTSLNTKGGER